MANTFDSEIPRSAVMDFPAVVSGQILPDGTLHVADALPLPPGPVRVHIEPLTPAQGETNTAPRKIVEREPGAIFLDDCISAPYDLPREGPSKRIFPRFVKEYLPEPHDLDEFTE